MQQRELPLPSRQQRGRTLVVARTAWRLRCDFELDAYGVSVCLGFVERIHALYAKARRNLQSLKFKNVSLKHGDGSSDLKEALAVDAIVVTAGATHVPTALLRYLNPGGRMVLPLAQPGDERGTQRLTVLEAAAGGIVERTLDAVRFVPLLSGLA